ncbi:MAG: PASTA domain-containing protein [Deltaproteobacteria bacterium]|nr:PASTA domain-containing protein [Deltaproteobacteria bacterium]
MKKLFYVLVMFITFIFSMYLTMGFLLKTEKTILCPDIRGLTLPEAELILKKCGLELQILRQEKRSDVAKGVIVRQRPEGNVPVKKGRRVYVTVSAGPDLVIVPNVKGLTVETAYAVVSEKKIKIKEKILVPSKYDGKVLAQIPKESEKILEGEGIVVIVGRKPEKYFVMPEISNWDFKELIEELESKEISYKITYEKNENPGWLNRITVDKKPGTIFRSSETVSINVFIGG